MPVTLRVGQPFQQQQPRTLGEPVPSAAAAKALHRRRATAPLRLNAVNMTGVGITVTRRRSPGCTPPRAAPGRPGASRPARTSTRYRPSPPGPAGRRCRRSGPTRRSWWTRSGSRLQLPQSALVSATGSPGYHAGEDAGEAAAQRGGVDARSFQHLPRGFQEQPLLGVGGRGLPRAHPKKSGSNAPASERNPPSRL